MQQISNNNNMTATQTTVDVNNEQDNRFATYKYVHTHAYTKSRYNSVVLTAIPVEELRL